MIVFPVIAAALVFGKFFNVNMVWGTHIFRLSVDGPKANHKR